MEALVIAAHSSHSKPADPPLTSSQRCALWALLAVFVAFGGIVELRSAFLKRRMTDLGVYLRAAWAVRSGHDIYQITDENGWHYQYPPTLAVLLTPLADPPPGVGRAGSLPFAASVGLWYLFNLGCLAFAVHTLARVVEEDCGERAVRAQHARRLNGQRRWMLRVVPLLICAIPIGQTLMRGQVSILLLALLSGMLWSWQRGQHWRAGYWLAAAICIKVIPAFFLIIPIWQRNLRWLSGCAIGLIVGLGVVPVATFGWSRTVDYYREFDRVVLRPGIGEDRDHSRARELMDMTSTDNQSLQALIHNVTHPDRWTRPDRVSPMVRFLHYAIGGLLTLITLQAFWRNPQAGGLERLLLLGALSVNMLLVSPVTHLHYLCLCLPLALGILVSALERGQVMCHGMRWQFAVALFFACGLMPALPYLEGTRDAGVAMFGAGVLWLFACTNLKTWRGGPSTALGMRRPSSYAA